jgi:hypothetical protein
LIDLEALCLFVIQASAAELSAIPAIYLAFGVELFVDREILPINRVICPDLLTAVSTFVLADDELSAYLASV